MIAGGNRIHNIANLLDDLASIAKRETPEDVAIDLSRYLGRKTLSRRATTRKSTTKAALDYQEQGRTN